MERDKRVLEQLLAIPWPARQEMLIVAHCGAHHLPVPRESIREFGRYELVDWPSVMFAIVLPARRMAMSGPTGEEPHRDVVAYPSVPMYSAHFAVCVNEIGKVSIVKSRHWRPGPVALINRNENADWEIPSRRLFAACRRWQSAINSRLA